jgi:hypothetical protein
MSEVSHRHIFFHKSLRMMWTWMICKALFQDSINRQVVIGALEISMVWILSVEGGTLVTSSNFLIYQASMFLLY